MMAPIRIVSPFRPFPIESEPHQALGPFDWIGALEMLQASVERNCPETTFTALTDVDTTLPVPAFQFKTRERRLMLWILEVCFKFLNSKHFDRDTVMVSPDMLVMGDLRRFFRGADLGVLVRPEQKHIDSGRPILNQVQFWRHKAKGKLIGFYNTALHIAKEQLTEDLIVWGGDTEPIRRLIEPIALGVTETQAWSVLVEQIHFSEVMESLSQLQIDQLTAGLPIQTSRPVLDFKYTRKRYQRAAFESLFGVPA